MRQSLQEIWDYVKRPNQRQIFMMIILTIIFLRIRYYITWSPSKKYTMIFIGMVELYVLMDALFMKELLGKSGNLLQFKLVVFSFYLVYVIMPVTNSPLCGICLCRVIWGLTVQRSKDLRK